jgi:hypothetical protein
MISNAPATPGLSATVLPVLAVLVRTHGVGAGALIALLLFVKRASVGTVQGAVASWCSCEAHTQEATRSLPLPLPYRPAGTRLEPIVPDPATKEPSAIDPLFKPRSNEDREDSRGSQIDDRGSQIEDKGSHRISMFDPRSSILDPLRFLRFFVVCIDLRRPDLAGENVCARSGGKQPQKVFKLRRKKNHDRPTTLQTM